MAKTFALASTVEVYAASEEEALREAPEELRASFHEALDLDLSASDVTVLDAERTDPSEAPDEEGYVTWNVRGYAATYVVTEDGRDEDTLRDIAAAYFEGVTGEPVLADEVLLLDGEADA